MTMYSTIKSKLQLFPRTFSSKHDPEAAFIESCKNRFQRDLYNPNRCIVCLVKEVGKSAGSYWPASDSMFFDTGFCGACGETDDVCDPPLLEAYLCEGLDVSNVSQSLGYNTNHQLVRLRFRPERSKPITTYPNHYEDVSLHEAIRRARIYLKHQHVTGDDS